MNSSIRKGLGMFEYVPGEVPYFRIPLLEDTGLVRAVFSTRLGGVSPAPYASMNLSWNRGDDPANTQANYEIFCRAMGWDPARVAQCHLIHSTIVLEAGEEDLGRITSSDHAPAREGDGFITDRRDIVLRQTFADCVPIWLLDPVRKAVAMLHAGWRGTVAGMAARGVEALAARYGSDPRDILAAVGPSIHPCCFAIRDDVADPLEASFPGAGLVIPGTDQPRGDLQKCNELWLRKAGVLPEHIAMSGLCTSCSTDLFFSHRAEKGKCGVMAGMIALL